MRAKLVWQGRLLELAGRRSAEQIDLEVEGAKHSFGLEPIDDGEYILTEGSRRERLVVARRGDDFWIWMAGRTYHLRQETSATSRGRDPGGGLHAPMPGQILKVLVREGQSVEKSQPLVIMEAMKMQYEIVAPRDGTVRKLHVEESMQVPGDMTLVELDAPGEST